LKKNRRIKRFSTIYKFIKVSKFTDMAKQNEGSKKNSPTGKSESKQEHKRGVLNLGKEKKRDTDDTGPRDKK
jgi:hypothetical protein